MSTDEPALPQRATTDATSNGAITAAPPATDETHTGSSPSASKQQLRASRSADLGATREHRRSRIALDVRNSLFKRRSHLSEDVRRDSGMASSLSTAAHNDEYGTGSTNAEMIARGNHEEEPAEAAPDVPSIVVQDASSVKQQQPQPNRLKKKQSRPSGQPRRRSSGLSEESASAEPRSINTTVRLVDGPFKRISTDIPTGELDDVFSSEELTFSKRGSVLWGGKKAQTVNEHTRNISSGSEKNAILGMIDLPTENDRSLSKEERRLSKRVRSMYEPGVQIVDNDGDAHSETRNGGDSEEQDKVMDLPEAISSSRLAEDQARLRALSALSGPSKEPFEAAGGIEDFTDIDVRDVDRYGFIRTRSQRSSVVSTPVPPGSPDTSRNQRTPATLTIVDEVPQRPTNSGSTNANRLSVANGGTSLRTSPSILSSHSKRSTSSGIHRMTLSRKQRWMEETGSMLTLSYGPSLDDTPLDATDFSTSSPSRKLLESKRAAKWEKMAKPVPRPRVDRQNPAAPTLGAGTDFTFDTTDSKLISRVFKGIPDRWRATAWHSFLTTSAARRSPTGRPDPPDELLVAAYAALQTRDCPDDVQIDTDVPRTVGAHVMFRRRYRGGQRLLFRVLRALALYFPSTGYVQGMAAIAATLLSYYDEERAFVMLVRLCALRGVGALYAEGFGGLVAALAEFDSRWLARSLPRVHRTLAALDIAPSAYGTKWFLTLFNYSVPFEAQLRLWDVLMLLGDPPRSSPLYKLPERAAAPQTQSTAPSQPTVGARDGAMEGASGKQDDPPPPHVDVLHAAATALLHGMQPALLDADFENAMRVLTSPVPVGRADVMMRAVKRELKEKGYKV